MRPCQLRTQCVRIWEHDVEPLHLLKIPHGETRSKLLLKQLRHVLQDAFSIFGPEASVLLMLYDDASDVAACRLSASSMSRQ